MGQISRKKIVVLIICLLLTGIVCNLSNTSTTAKKEISLKNALTDIKGWHYNGLRELPKNNLRILLTLLPGFYVVITGI